MNVITTEMDQDKQGKKNLTCKLGPFLNYGVAILKMSVAFWGTKYKFFSLLYAVNFSLSTPHHIIQNFHVLSTSGG